MTWRSKPEVAICSRCGTTVKVWPDGERRYEYPENYDGWLTLACRVLTHDFQVQEDA